MFQDNLLQVTGIDQNGVNLSGNKAGYINMGGYCAVPKLNEMFSPKVVATITSRPLHLSPVLNGPCWVHRVMDSSLLNQPLGCATE